VRSRRENRDLVNQFAARTFARGERSTFVLMTNFRAFHQLAIELRAQRCQ